MPTPEVEAVLLICATGSAFSTLALRCGYAHDDRLQERHFGLINTQGKSQSNPRRGVVVDRCDAHARVGQFFYRYPQTTY